MKKHLLLGFLILFTGLCFLVLTPSVKAQCRTFTPYRSYSYSHSYNYAPAYVEKKVYHDKYEVVIPAFFKFVEIPTYSFLHAPSIAPAAPSAAHAPNDFKMLVEMLTSLKKDVDELKKGTPAPMTRVPETPTPMNATTPAPLPNGLRVAQAKCAACHVKGKESDGGDFVLLNEDGSRAKLTALQAGSFAKRVNNGSMPPKSNKHGITPLQDSEAFALIDDLPNYLK